ncbi:MAG: hypothetical protein M3Y57_09655 [Acidobacteriota bacterium]|nr:hypothetical protein [Acidobacteriota bacterium]
MFSAALALLLSKPVEATEILTGQFVAGSKTNDSPLKHGTFELAFDTANLPLPSQCQSCEVFLHNWDLTFRSATGTIILTLNSSEPGSAGTVRPLTRKRIGDELIVSNSTEHDVLALLFPIGFDGTGQAIPSAAYSYGIAQGTDKLAVKSAATVPEPSSMGLWITAMFLFSGSALPHWTRWLRRL